MNARHRGYRPGMDVRTVAGRLGGAALLSGALVGCGSGDETVTSATADTLHRQVDTVRTAVAAGREPAALAAVADLRSTIRRLASAGELDPADSLVLLTQLDRIENRIGALPTPRPTPRPTPVPEPGPAGPGSNGADQGVEGKGADDGADKGKGPPGQKKAKGKGRG